MSLLVNFNQQCKHTANNIAFIEGDRQLSYKQVQQQVARLCYLLSTKHTNIQRVAIALDRGIDAAVAIFSVLHHGSCYIPLDIKNPDNRLAFIINDADVQLIIGKGACPTWLDQTELWLDINQKISATTNVTKAPAIKAESLATILYTSGSTGHPKGVALSHRAMTNFADWAADTFKLSDKDNIASLAPFHFDLSVFDLFSSLSRGATVSFIPNHLTMSPSRLTAWLQKQKISVWYTVPSILSFIALKGALSDTPLPDLKIILFAGEVFPTPLLIKLGDLLPDVKFYNLYGPTETNVCCYWPVDKTQLHADHAIPIGIPAAGSKLEINQETSELRVKSANNLSGYWQDGQLIPALSTAGFYATGDKVSVNSEGDYCYHGRLDRMLKCSGYRVEPAEIEKKLQQCAGVTHCAVIGIKDKTSGQRPAAVLTLKDSAVLAEIVNTLRQQLPAYMQPCQYIVLESLPYLNNGKMDYQTLQMQLEKA